MKDSLDRQMYVRLTELEGEALEAFAASQAHPVTRSAVVRAAVVKWLIASGNLPSDYSLMRREKYQSRDGRETVFNMTKHDAFSH